MTKLLGNQTEKVRGWPLLVSERIIVYVTFCMKFGFDLCLAIDNRLRTPIIVVPAAATSVITLWNVKEFLEDYKLVFAVKDTCMYGGNAHCIQ